MLSASILYRVSYQSSKSIIEHCRWLGCSFDQPEFSINVSFLIIEALLVQALKLAGAVGHGGMPLSLNFYTLSSQKKCFSNAYATSRMYGHVLGVG